MRKTNKFESAFQWWSPSALSASPHGGLDIKYSLSELHAKLRPPPRKESNKKFTEVFFFKVHDHVHRPTAAAVVGGNCRQMAQQTSYQKSDTALRQSVLCQLSKHNLVHSKKIGRCLFIKTCSSSHYRYVGKSCNCNPNCTFTPCYSFWA